VGSCERGTAAKNQHERCRIDRHDCADGADDMEVFGDGRLAGQAEEIDDRA